MEVVQNHFVLLVEPIFRYFILLQFIFKKRIVGTKILYLSLIDPYFYIQKIEKQSIFFHIEIYL